MGSPADTYLIVGLGNPGERYCHTRHNAGFMLVDKLAENLNLKFRTAAKFKGEIAEGSVDGRKVMLLKPQTFMNLSGESVAAVVGFYKIPISEILVAYDDLDLPLGKIRLRQGGGDGGHNGIKSLLALLGSDDFVRLRLGIGRPQGSQEVTGWVLGGFQPDERNVWPEVMNSGVKAVESLIGDGLIKTQNKFN